MKSFRIKELKKKRFEKLLRIHIVKLMSIMKTIDRAVISGCAEPFDQLAFLTFLVNSS